MVNATAMKACPKAVVPPRRALVSRCAAVAHLVADAVHDAATSRPYRHRPTVHSRSAPRSSRHASPKTPRSAAAAVPGPIGN
jgi:hypothetical protein